VIFRRFLRYIRSGCLVALIIMGDACGLDARSMPKIEVIPLANEAYEASRNDSPDTTSISLVLKLTT
jgi:hypothetical protein